MDDAQDRGELLLQPLTPVTKPRPKALWAALAAVVLALGALAVVNLGGEGDEAAPSIPISLLAGGGGRAETAAASDLARVRYEAGPDLPALGGTGPAYRLGTATDAQVRHLAEVLGFAGAPHPDAGHWTIQDGAGLLNVNASGGAWWFNGAAVAGDQGTSSSGASAGCGPGADCAVASCAPGMDCQAATTTTYDPCAAPNTDCTSTPVEAVPSEGGTTGGSDDVAPPVTAVPDPLPPDTAPCAKVVSPECGTAPDPDLPSKDGARDVAIAFLERTGTDTHDATVTVDGGGSTWVVSVEPPLDGRQSGLVSQAFVGANGEIQGASGFLVDPELLGSYPMLTTHATIDRTNRMMVWPVSVVADDTAARDAVRTPADPMTSTTVTGCKVQPTGIEICEQTDPGASDTPLVDPGQDYTCEQTDTDGAACSGGGTTTPGNTGTGVVPPPTVPPIAMPVEPATVTLVDAVPTLTMIGASDGSSDLYLVPAYRFTPEGGGQVDLIAISDDSIAGPPSTETTVPATDGIVEPPATTPSDCETLVEGDDTGTTHTIQPCPPTTPTVAVDPVDPDEPATSVAVTPETAPSRVAEP